MGATSLRHGQEVMLNEAAQRGRRLRFRRGRRGRDAQGDPRRRRARPGDRQRRRGARRPPRGAAARADAACRRLAAARARSGYVYERVPKSEVEELVLEEVPDIDYESHRAAWSTRSRQIRDAVEAAVPPPRAVHRAPAEAAQGSPALRTPGLRQDADRQGGRQLPGQEGREPRRGQEGSLYFLNIKGPELLNKYVGETERHIRLVFQRAREKASGGTPGHRLLRRDGLAVPHPRVRRLLRRREHHRPAAAERDRRRRAARERAGHRRLQPRGHDRPGDPAARPPRREDQDRAPRRRVGPRHLQQVPRRQPAAARRRPGGVRGDRDACVARDDPGHGRADVHRDRGEPLPGGHLREGSTRRSSTSRTSTPAR